MGPRTAVILTTYNWPRALELTLTGLSVQSDPEFEVLVADDGSGPETRDLVERLSKDSPFPLRHVWQEDKGYRRAAVLNRAVRSCDADLIVISDQDAIPARNWVSLHREAYAPNRIVPGGYIRLTREQSDSLDTEKVRQGIHETMMTSSRMWSLRKKHLYNLFYIATFRKIFPRIMGLNFSVSRDLFEKVNGFDEEYVGWGKEDSDLRTRMRQAGGGARCLWHRSIVYHLWHTPQPSKRNMKPNKERYQMVKRRALPWRCERGLLQ